MGDPDRGTYLVLHEFMFRGLGLSGVALLVYARIYGFCLDGGDFYESRRGTAEYLGVSERAVHKAMRHLESRGLVQECGTYRLASGRRTKRYRITAAPARRAREEAGRRAASAPEARAGERRPSPEQSAAQGTFIPELSSPIRLNRSQPDKKSR